MGEALSNTRGPAGCYIGLKITRHRVTHELLLDETLYLKKLVRKFGFQDSVPLSVPVDPHTHLRFLSSNDCFYYPTFPYHTIVGCLQFSCIGTHPDLSYEISVAAKYCANPSPAHCNALCRILKYLAGTLQFGISFSGNDHPLTLTTYSYADFAMDLDDCLGFILVNHGPVLWASRKPLLSECLKYCSVMHHCGKISCCILHYQRDHVAKKIALQSWQNPHFSYPFIH